MYHAIWNLVLEDLDVCLNLFQTTNGAIRMFVSICSKKQQTVQFGCLFEFVKKKLTMQFECLFEFVPNTVFWMFV